MLRVDDDRPDDHEMRVPWTLGAEAADQGPDGLIAAAVDHRGSAGSLRRLGPSTLSIARAALLEQQLTLPFRRTRRRCSTSRSAARAACAAQSWPLARIKAVKYAAGVTVNDVVLAMCAGALRAYLIERDALPDRPLVAMVPVSLRTPGRQDAGGNMVGTILCNLATDIDDPAKRLDAISTSMRDNKKVFAELPRTRRSPCRPS